MKLVADQQIPLVAEYFSPHFTIAEYPLAELTAAAIADADVLLVRSTLQVDHALLANSTCRMVVTTTSGYEHLDTHYLDQRGIQWAHAAGCNAQSVAEYVIACVALLRQNHLLPPLPQIGIIGVGHVGQRVAAKLSACGCNVLLNDPPRYATESDFPHVPLSALQQCHVICVHASLQTTGPYANIGLLNNDFLASLAPGTVIINAARGDILDQSAAGKLHNHLIFCCDVFHNEPAIDPNFVEQVYLATPHIAGHAIQAKWRGTQMAYSSVATAFNLPSTINIAAPLPQPTYRLPTDSWESAVLTLYDPRDDQRLLLAASRTESQLAKDFQYLRNHYRVRHEFTFPVISNWRELDELTQQILLA